jgi:hypothetical protein
MHLLKKLKLPDEHPIATFREWAKIVVPFLALIAATTAGGIALAQYFLASGSAERQDRAYLLADKVVIDLKAEAVPRVTVVIKNFGRTPSFNFTVTSECKVVRSLLSAFGKPPEPDHLLNGVIAPGGASTFYAACNEKITQQDITDLSSKKIVVYFLGLIEYRDVFNRLHRTIIRRLVGGPAGLNGEFMANSPDPKEGDETD